MSQTSTFHLRPAVSGKFFRLGEKKFFLKGVTYGPFAPNDEGDHFPTKERAQRDLELIRNLGANLLRVYNVPPRWLLDLAEKYEVKFLIDIPWSKHLCFLDSDDLRAEAHQAVADAVRSCARHPSVFAYSVVNEISPDIVRWSGTQAIEEFIDGLVATAKAMDPECLCTFANYPSTEFLNPKTIDFVCFNVYLHNRRPFENYLARLQMIANTKPLILGEIGVDSTGEGESVQSQILGWQIESGFRGGLAGMVVYSFTDEWYRNGAQVEGWTFGLTTKTRKPKPAFDVVKKGFQTAPYFPLPRYPKVSVVVASYNGGRTLQACLESLQHLNYPDYEVILVDDGSTDITRQLASLYKSVRYIYEPNLGLSIARNTGINTATGDVIAYTDSDCRADEDWLFYLISDLLKGTFVGVGGHNLLPPEDSAIAAAVMVSPGGPAHVMLSDRIAEHIPGCNMAFYKWALHEIGGFDPLFRKAGDDVDICWRLQQQGYKIGFSPASFVWHYRRSTVGAYLKQQQGYGEAEALLVRRHPEYFNLFGNSIWQGRIYAPAKLGLSLRKPIIYHGLFATGLFQTIYRTESSAYVLMLATTMEYHVVVNLPLLVLCVPFWQILPLTIASVLLSISVCIAAACQADLVQTKHRFWSRPLIALLFFLQPIARGWARYQGRLSLRPTPSPALESLASLPIQDRSGPLNRLEYWAEKWVDRIQFIKQILGKLDEQGWQSRIDAGWSDHDIEVYGSRWAQLQLATVSEPYAGGKEILRCRLDTTWSLPAKLAFFTMLVVDVLLIGLLQHKFPWIWALVATPVIFAIFMIREQRSLQRLISLVIGSAAKQCGLIRIDRYAPVQQPIPHSEPPPQSPFSSH